MLFYVFAYKNTNKHRIPLTFQREKTKIERKATDFEQKSIPPPPRNTATSHSLLQPREAVEIGAYIIIHLPLQELTTTLLDPLAILSIQAEQVALELDALRLQ